MLERQWAVSERQMQKRAVPAARMGCRGQVNSGEAGR